MDKHKVHNGFTIVEMLFVLLIVCMFSIPIQKPKSSLTMFMKQMMAYSITMQQKAFETKQEVNVTINKHNALFDEYSVDYPSNISCTPVSFHYNENGNISKALTLSCYEENKQMKLIYQLGSGRVRYE
ncbi:competence type IV pilus minor pilin ComGD [Floccifex sp.]|uniref:competence type IV pilus minor pilin ComGD n=1 Tax=Floccifex sp. TaxID=2815810 RepID=UPI002A75A137|nr:competence type IV pilus minor pilin ComGD [Floccifex sp.]MDD7281380.1 competence type IV pilus minor pilin ComGD [Erysipelotrichaceae bacterium]MDY2958085.1 competence type IV pilus minor pilin ComGD [Floccifex sp.]